MILYLDTSSLAKLYVQESGSESVRWLAGNALTLATSAVAYVEMRAMFARKRRANETSDDEHKRLLPQFERDWLTYLSVELSDPLIRVAGDLAEKHALRGFDAIHLSSALSLRFELASPITFSSADERLRRAAEGEGFNIGYGPSVPPGEVR